MTTTPESLSACEARELVRRFGFNCNSFMTLYPGFSFFAPTREEAQAYVDTPSAWVGASEPLAERGRELDVLDRFADAAAAQGKTAIVLPVNASLAERAVARGFRSILIGSEAKFALAEYPRPGRGWLDVVPTARQLDSRGARVEELTGGPARHRAALDPITREWLRSRKTAALGFLNQVDPWAHSEHKRYFAIRQQGVILAYLAAIPIWARDGWYLVDLIRKSDTPPGTTELLLLQTMRMLKDSGAREVSLGVAPLSGLDKLGELTWLEGDRQSFLYRALHFAYDRGDWFYNFKSLHLYKLKFEPTSSEPMFLLFRAARAGGGFGLRDALGVTRAFVPDGVLNAASSTVARKFARFDPGTWLSHRVRPDLVTRPEAHGVVQRIEQSWLTITLGAVNLLAYALTVGTRARIPAGTERVWGYSWAAFHDHPLRSLALSPFLHWDPVHLAFNLLTLAVFAGGLERLLGARILALSYLIPMWLANPLTSPWLVMAWPQAVNRLDIGASLGIFGAMGAILRCVRGGTWILVTVLLLVLAHAGATGNWLELNHCVALALGLAISRLSVR